MKMWVVFCWALLALVGADECPDGGRCKDGQTCCNDPPANGYECCPFDQAECCGDHKHCCPMGTVCDTATSSCLNSTGSIPWVERASADQLGLSKSFRMIKTYMGEDDDNICPDKSRCPPEFSCLKALTRFGCCPLAQGVSCSDGKHCCPEGHQCSADSRSCIKKELVTTVLCSDGVSECPDETTCCITTEGKWGCCPMPQAVCCEDKTHCCPEGNTCDIAHSKCISSSTKKESPMWAKLPARIREDWENQKEGDQVTAQTVVGGDSEKSPELTTANTVPPSKKEVNVSSVTKAAPGNDVPCNDTASCPDGTTCCKTQEGGWACCPLPEAVCCEDFIHCCPKGKTCNLAAQKCEDDTHSVPWVQKVPTKPRQGVRVQDVKCNDTASCPDGTTCCKTKEGEWACCPLPEAVCCDDHEHCCPTGTTCDPTTLQCDGTSGSTPMKQKIPAFVTAAPTTAASTSQTEGNDVPCNDTASCPDGTTCCKTQEGGWACCPLPEAVCCEDFIHCCPKGKTCNLAAQKCEDDICSVPWVQKVPTKPRQGVRAQDVKCNDTASCPDGTTCCKTKEGEWACCPLPEAVCCDDHEHCCPTGTTCDLTTLQCDGTSGSTPMKQKIPAFVTAAPTPKPRQGVRAQDVKCNDTASCPDGTTCCKTKEGEWACCPLPEAVCCDDHEHCCPTGTTCDPTTLQCDGTSGSTPMKQKIPAFVTAAPTTAASTSQTEGNDVPCNDTASCPDGTTCCKTQEGGWACCPLPEAVCCEDFIHCCPKGKTCNLAAQKCEDDTHSVPWVQKVPTKPRQGVRAQDVKCDDTGSCPDGTTCCKTQEGGWACCPLPEAVCCEDFIHCCPKGKTCNLAAQTCDDDTHSVPWVQKVPTKPTQVQTEKETESEQADEKKAQETDDDQEKEDEEEEENKEEEDVPCHNNTSCPTGTSCCFMKSTQKWGCCPLPEAVCCADGNHCCPKHYKCDESKTTCVKGEVEIPWYTKLPATTRAEADHSSVQCDDTIQCPDHTTCCQLSTGEWGCCPLPNAVCCQDKEHCCPQGFTCNAASNSCQKLILLEVEFVPLTPVLVPEHRPLLSPSKHRDVPCDEQTSCPDGQTCCRMSPTTWGCCPSPNAVCCSDMQHCCPTGYTCTSTGDCVQNSRLQWHDWYMFLANKKRALVV